MGSLALGDQFQGSAYLAGHAGNAEPADALLVLEVTLDTGQRLTRPAAHDGPHINWQTSARALPLNVRHPQARASQCLRSEWHRTCLQ